MNKPHKHAQLMLQYAQDAAETDRPWERWEVLVADKWVGNGGPMMFDADIEYRRKPSVIVINGIEVPEPMRKKPEDGTRNRPCQSEKD